MRNILMIVTLLASVMYADTTLCSNDSKVVLSCEIKKKKLSVCKYKNNQIIYRYGTSHKVELEIKSKPSFSSMQFVRANYENHLRFHNKGYDYVVYSNEFLEYDKHPNDGTARYVEHSGLYVVKKKKVLAKLTCNKMYNKMIGIGNASKGVLEETYIGYYK